MYKVALSDTWLKANSGRSRAKTVEVADRDGLSVRVTPKGKVTFQIRYRYAGKASRLDIGTYPHTGLKQAREEAQRLRAMLDAGHDPKINKALERSKIKTALTLTELFGRWYEADAVPNKKRAAEHMRTFELHVQPTFGHLPAGSITLHHWLHLLEPLAKRRPAIAERVLSDASQMYHWGRRRQMVDANPLVDITRRDLSIKRTVGERSLSGVELRQVWSAIEDSRVSQKNRLFLKLCIFYGCRNGEMRKAEASHFDFKAMVWTVPPDNHKMGKKTGKPLLRPIIPEVVPWIEQAIALSHPSPFLFQNLRSQKQEPTGERAVLSLPRNLMIFLKKRRGIDMQHWSMHDLRKTARTNWSELTQPHIAEIMLGHKLPGVWQVYDHHKYLDEQAEAYKAWWFELQGIVGA